MNQSPEEAAALPPSPRPIVLVSGGVLGFIGCASGLLIFFAGCAGQNAAFRLSPIPVGISALGLLLALGGSIFERRKITEDTHVLAAFFTASLGVIGGLIEMGVWLNWPMLRS